MCGIAGYLNCDGAPAHSTVLKPMNDALVHRGPDGEGSFFYHSFALGHRRLAIIDLGVTAAQPMISACGRYVLSYNGELYNFREIRAELVSKGHRFSSTGDTEVFLTAIAVWGERAIERFNGMFAAAVWDRKERTLWLMRDRYGIKPLYYGRFGSTFVFGSEIKALAKHPAFTKKIDTSSLVEYMTFQNFFTERTLFTDVRLLPAGTIARVRSDGTMSQSRYWDYHFHEPENPASEKQLSEQLDFLFRQAVERQLISDVEVGGYLSGGMDSGAITAMAARFLPYMKSFTCGCDLRSASGIELTFDERAGAELMSYKFRTEHYEMVLKSGDMERVMPTLVHHLEEPRVGQCYPNFYASKLAGHFVKVVLSGVGGDELFGGYPWRYYRAVSNDNFDHYVTNYYDFWQRLIPDTLKPQVFAPIWSEVRDVSTRDIFTSVFGNKSDKLLRPEDYVNYSLYLEARTFLHGLLVVEDKMSMAHSLETRVPFLDNDLVDFAMALPARQRLGNLTEVVRFNENQFGGKRAQYYQRYQDGKLLLRNVMRNYVPEEVANREKQGFSAPDASWFKGESIEYVNRLLGRQDARIYDFLDRAAIRVILEQHMSGKENKRLLIWSLIYLENLLSLYEMPRRTDAPNYEIQA